MTVLAVTDVDRVRIRRAVVQLDAAAEDIADVATRVASRSAAVDWCGPARARHDERAVALAHDLRAAAATLRDVAADAAHALAVAVRRADDAAAAVGGPATPADARSAQARGGPTRAAGSTIVRTVGGGVPTGALW